MYSGMGTRALPRAGFPIRTSRDQRLVSTYSGLFAAAHVLLRLLAPRHPPCALSLLIVKNTLYAAMEFSRCAPAPSVRPNEKTLLEAGLSKLSSTDRVEVDVFPGELVTGRKGSPCQTDVRHGHFPSNGRATHRSKALRYP